MSYGTLAGDVEGGANASWENTYSAYSWTFTSKRLFLSFVHSTNFITHNDHESTYLPHGIGSTNGFGHTLTRALIILMHLF